MERIPTSLSLGGIMPTQLWTIILIMLIIVSLYFLWPCFFYQLPSICSLYHSSNDGSWIKKSTWSSSHIKSLASPLATSKNGLLCNRINFSNLIICHLNNEKHAVIGKILLDRPPILITEISNWWVLNIKVIELLVRCFFHDTMQDWQWGVGRNAFLNDFECCLFSVLPKRYFVGRLHTTVLLKEDP